jgi:hypothetical protein
VCETGKSRAKIKQWTFASPRDNKKPERKNGGSKQVCVHEEMERQSKSVRMNQAAGSDVFGQLTFL